LKSSKTTISSYYKVGMSDGSAIHTRWIPASVLCEDIAIACYFKHKRKNKN